MSYSVERFKLSDWDDLVPRPEAAADFEVIKNEIIFKEAYTNGMPFFTLRYNGEIIVVYGFMYAGMGTYFPAVVAGCNMHKHVRKVLTLFYEYFATYVPRDCRRMEAYCDIMDVKAVTLAKHFGFDVVGIRHNATASGNDQVILERLVLMDPRKVMRSN
jgi:hypothetical protein